MAMKLLDDTRSEMRAAVTKLMQILHKLMGDKFIESVTSSKLAKVKSILKC